jgi:uncharacterized zinc-type alcohol dehydrogenase-like protein
MKRSTTSPRDYGAYAADRPLGPINDQRRTTRSRHIQIDIVYCGVCRSGLNTVRWEWGGTS